MTSVTEIHLSFSRRVLNTDNQQPELSRHKIRLNGCMPIRLSFLVLHSSHCVYVQAFGRRKILEVAAGSVAYLWWLRAAQLEPVV